MMAVGSKGSDVLQLQRDLSSCGFNPGPLDGILGPLTTVAVKALQSYCGLSVNGRYTADDFKALQLLLPQQSKTVESFEQAFFGTGICLPLLRHGTGKCQTDNNAGATAGEARQ